MRTAIFVVAGIAALVAAFLLGMRYQAHIQPEAPKPAGVYTTPPELDPVKKLQLSTLCAQAAAAYASEHYIVGLEGIKNDYEHGYNYRLQKCLVEVNTYIAAPPVAGSYARIIHELSDAADGADYGKFRIKIGPVGGTFGRTIESCIMKADGLTEKVCQSQEGWDAYIDLMLHG